MNNNRLRIVIIAIITIAVTSMGFFSCTSKGVTPTIAPTPVATPSGTVLPILTATPVPLPTVVPLPTTLPKPTATLAPIPSPTVLPKPTATPTPAIVEEPLSLQEGLNQIEVTVIELAELPVFESLDELQIGGFSLPSELVSIPPVNLDISYQGKIEIISPIR